MKIYNERVLKELSEKHNTDVFELYYTTESQVTFAAKLVSLALDKIEALEKRVSELESKQ